MTEAPPRSQRAWFVGMALWLAFSIGVSVAKNGVDAAALTRLGILVFFALSLAWYARWGKTLVPARPRLFFFAWLVCGAWVGESCYMISKPLNPALLITRETPLPDALRRWAIDLVLTTPAYLGIATVLWWALNRYRYSPLAYLFAMGLGQSLGDGNAFFLANPAMLLFVPYVMLNYWAMSFVPFLVVRGGLKPTVQPAWRGVVVLLVALPVTYLAVAVVIITAGRLVGWLPPE